MRSHLCEDTSDLQCDDKISFDLWNCSVTHSLFYRERDVADQKFCSQAKKNTKQVLVNNYRSLQSYFSNSVEDRNLHTLSQDLFRLQDHRFSQTLSEFRNEESDYRDLQKDTSVTQH